MTESPPKLPDDSRLGRAGVLADYLRNNPREARRDPEELGRQFGVGTDLVAQIQTSILTKSRTQREPKGRVDLIVRVKEAWASGVGLVDRLVDKPYLFLALVGLVVIALVVAPGKAGKSAALAVWVAAEVLCLTLRPKFRYALFDSLVLFLMVGISAATKTQDEVLPAPFSGPLGNILLAFFIALACLICNTIAGGILVVLVGSIRVAGIRRRESVRTRQDLLSRMFQLEEELLTIPEKSAKPPKPVLLKLRKQLLAFSAISTLLLGSVEACLDLAFHLDPYRLATTTHSISTRASHIKVSAFDIPALYLTAMMMVAVVKFASVILIGFLATSRRKVFDACLGLLIGNVLVYAWAWPLKGFGDIPAGIAAVSVLVNALRFSVIVLIVRFCVYFNRTLVRYRMGSATDEASIVSELLEIRHRLSANPVEVCVLVVDAAGSTKMKRNADPLKVEYSFGRYQRWISATVVRNGGKVDIVTGDGAICAFGTAEKAYAAARDLQSEVATLNTEENRLEAPFRLRVALHSGAVVADLDKVQFTEVIDVAAHVEKLSPVGGIALTEPFLRSMEEVLVVEPTSSIDGVDVFTLALA